MRFASKKSVSDIAKDLGMTYAASVGPKESDVVGMNLDGTRKDVVESTDGLRVQFGNHGTKYWLGDSDDRPSRRGYIAVQHQLNLPKMYFNSMAYGAVTPLNVASSVINFVSIFDNAEGAYSNTPAQVFDRQSQEIKVPRKSGFKVRCEKERLGEGEALVTETALPLIKELAKSFDVEVGPGWVVAYNAFGDISTKDADVWQWALGATSRIVDLLRLWGADADFGAQWPHYNPEIVSRPAHLDGTLGRLKRSK